jgi:hypothetical protein
MTKTAENQQQRCDPTQSGVTTEDMKKRMFCIHNALVCGNNLSAIQSQLHTGIHKFWQGERPREPNVYGYRKS